MHNDTHTTCWPLEDCVRKLAEFAHYMLHDRGYDGCGWEELDQACQGAQHWLKQFEYIPPIDEDGNGPDTGIQIIDYPKG